MVTTCKFSESKNIFDSSYEVLGMTKLQYDYIRYCVSQRISLLTDWERQNVLDYEDSKELQDLREIYDSLLNLKHI